MTRLVLLSLVLVACVSTPRGVITSHLRACVYDARVSNGKGLEWCQDQAAKACTAAGLAPDCAATKLSEDMFWDCMDQSETNARTPPGVQPLNNWCH